MGLALSLATAFLITQGMKLIFGKPRPDLLSRCNPDLTRIREFTINRVGETFNQNWVLVTSGICQNPDRSRGGELMDGFKSFPSGHASFSWAGLLYLSLFLASNPLPPAAPLQLQPGAYIRNRALEHKEASHALLPQARLNPFLAFYTHQLRRRIHSTNALSKRRATRIHPYPRARPHRRRYLHCCHALHGFQTLWLRFAVWQFHRHYHELVQFQVLPFADYEGCGMGVGTEELSEGFWHWGWYGELCGD
jgi:hypothetical protein